MYPRLAVLAGGLILLCTVPLAAQDAVLSQMYGSGVHAFFSGDYGQAYEHLTAAADGGTDDPRCYYFRGLTFLQLGREEEAKLDFEQAAQLEAEDINKFYNVSRALERIQGSTRLGVERYRVKARMEGMQREEERRGKGQRVARVGQRERHVLDGADRTHAALPIEAEIGQRGDREDQGGLPGFLQQRQRQAGQDDQVGQYPQDEHQEYERSPL